MNKLLNTLSYQYIEEKGEEENKIFVDSLKSQSYIQSKLNSDMLLELYDSNTLDFAERARNYISKIMDKDFFIPLDQIHKALTPKEMTFDSTGVSPISEKFYHFEKEMVNLYHLFVKNVLEKEIFFEPLIFQKTPTFRFSFPSSPGFTWKPNYHTDIMLGHPPEEINIWLPLTNCFDSNAFRCASLDDSMKIFADIDYNLAKFALQVEDDKIQNHCENITKSISMNYGEYLIFDSRCLHVHQKNHTDKTRISIDFRVIPQSVYDKMPKNYVGTGRLKKRFICGDYYDSKLSNEL